MEKRGEKEQKLRAFSGDQPFAEIENTAGDEEKGHEKAGPRQPQFRNIEGLREDVAAKDVLHSPAGRPENIPEHERFLVHPDAAGDERNQFLAAGDEAAEKNTLGAMRVKEISRLCDMAGCSGNRK